jgi:hypothetical protein
MNNATVLEATGTCPSWCVTPDGCDARTAPHPDDRRHRSWSVVVPLSLEPPREGLRVGPGGLEVYLTSDPQELRAVAGQHCDEAEPTVELSQDLSTGDVTSACYEATMTLTEAEELARGILALVDEARGSR